MTVREYIGARYVPLFMGDWDNTNAYEPLSIVIYQGDSYTSRQAVPVGIPITNTAYWAVTGNYNAQVEAYRQEVRNLAGIIPDTEFSDENTVKDYINDTVGTLGDDVDALEAMLPASAFSDANTVKDYIDALGAILPATDFSSANTVKDYVDSSIENDKANADVTKYGAIPNSADVDWDSVFASCVANGNGVYFPNGTWIIQDEYTIPDCNFIVGDSAILSFTAIDSKLIIDNTFANRFFTMSNLKFDGNHIARNAIEFMFANQGEINNCHFKNFLDTCINCLYLGLQISNCSFIDTDGYNNPELTDFRMTGIKCLTDNVIIGCKFFHCKYSIKVNGTSTIIGCYFYGTCEGIRTNYAIWGNTEALLRNLIVIGCEFDNIRYSFSSISRGKIANCNWLWDNTVYAGINSIFYATDPNIVSYVDLSRCIFQTPPNSTLVEYVIKTFSTSSEVPNIQVISYTSSHCSYAVRKTVDSTHQFNITAGWQEGEAGGTLDVARCTLFESEPITSSHASIRQVFENNYAALKLIAPNIISNGKCVYVASVLNPTNPIAVGSTDRSTMYLRGTFNSWNKITLNGYAYNMHFNQVSSMPTLDWSINAQQLATV